MQKHSFDNPYRFVKMAKICKTCDNFCDVQIYPAIIWTCRHLTGAFQKIFKIVTQEFHRA